MNKQESIKKLESIKAIGNDAIAACYNESMNAGITLMKKIDEPHKPVVPKFVAEWIEYAKKKGDSLAISFKPWNLYGVEYSKADRWIEDNQETFARAWIDGYEVEKEPLYTVTLSLDLKYYLVIDEYECDGISPTLTTSSDVLGYRYFLTEKEIKSADENLWLIAVPVEEVAEG
ncbi:Protein of unknown function (DUF1642) [Enterococcus faecium]|uniref:DUF1642 domain-containing protein n=1 Tax=Enterococcus faecium TaxID=1352 RepID=UPI001F1D6108|nr:DUF1642 domain-containing protein [Enterococcus faecium]CAH2261171.1 Protein of unknown function (DUF1642) [Enterococcus faecium]